MVAPQDPKTPIRTPIAIPPLLKSVRAQNRVTYESDEEVVDHVRHLEGACQSPDVIKSPQISCKIGMFGSGKSMSKDKDRPVTIEPPVTQHVCAKCFTVLSFVLACQF